MVRQGREGPPGRIWCAVPVYNNGRTLRSVVRGCLGMLPDVVVVDDGSTDADVGELLDGLHVTILRHETNMGKGAAIMTASRFIEHQGGVYMITLDADGQHDPADIARLIPHLLADDRDLVVGCRDFNTDNVPAASRFGRDFAGFWLRVESGVHLDDCQSGFRAYPVRHLNRLEFAGRRFDFEAEALARLSWAGIGIKGVEVSVKYPPPKERITHFRPFMDNLRLTLAHTKLIGRRLLPFPQRRFVPREKKDIKVVLHPVNAVRWLLTENATPGGLAAAAAAGIFIATLPLLFVHTLVILYVATRLNLNKVVALNVQHLCLPPFVPALCIETGYYLRHGQWLTELSYRTIFEQFSSRLLEWLLGSLVLAPVLAFVAGIAVYALARFLKGRRTSSV